MTEIRAAPAGETPALTVAIIELSGGEALARRAAELADLSRRYPVSLLIICRSDGAGSAAVSGAKVFPAGGDTVPRRRLTALHQSRDEVLCLVEDTMRISGEWIENVMAAFRDKTVSAAWGPIELSPRLGARYRALGALEYGRFAAPSEGALLPGACMAFRRSALAAALAPGDGGIVEHELAARIAATGGRIACAPGMRAIYEAEDSYGARLTTRFAHGRLYAGTAAAGKSAPERLAFAVKSLLVPAVLTMRAARAAGASDNAALSPSLLFWIGAMSCSWAAGECCGWLAGPGDSARSWR